MNAEMMMMMIVFNNIFLNKQLFIWLFQVLDHLSVSSGFRNVRDYMESHLPYLLQYWLDVPYKIFDFPFQLLSFTSVEDFLRYANI